MSDRSTPPRSSSTDHPPGSSPAARRLASAIFRPLERFLAIEAASGILLMAAAVIAMVWANSPWGGSYERVWETRLGAAIGTNATQVSLRFVVNDVLMSVFFLVVGLEIRRELHAGELSEARRAALPIVAAVGGMLVPGLLYALASPSGVAARGWAIPMATDIAFAVGVLTLLGTRVPPALRVLLLALAIIDDLGAILVIAIFYSRGLGGAGLALAGACVALFVILRALGVRRVGIYLIPAVGLWVGIATAGLHPTVAGVITGLAIPTAAWAGHEERSPGQQLEHVLHPWVAYVVMPVFALANAGVALAGVELAAARGVALGIAGGLVLGKLVGILAACALGVRLGIAALPRGVGWRGILVVASVGGIGFTMSLFISGLAFATTPSLHAVAKLSVLVASATAAVAALALGRALLPATPPAVAATSVAEAEASIER